MDMLSPKQKLFLYLGIGGVILIAIFYYINTINKIGDDNNEINSFIEENVIEEAEEVEENTIIVHITGAVNTPGIVKITENARINDVIEKAGGLLDNADVSNVNLAYIVEDGQKIYIPFQGETGETVDDGDVVSEGAGENILQEGVDETSSSASSGLININKATKEKLEELPGIGSSTASKIITYREENGKFKSIEDIKNVSGIGDAKYEQIKSHICI